MSNIIYFKFVSGVTVCVEAERRGAVLCAPATGGKRNGRKQGSSGKTTFSITEKKGLVYSVHDPDP